MGGAKGPAQGDYQKMAIHKLKPAFIEKVTRKGLYSDGGGLSLKVRGSSKAWVFRYARSRFDSKAKGEVEMGLGPLNTVSLQEARGLAQQYRLQLLKHIKPLEARKQAWDDAQREASKDVAFKVFAEDWLAFQSKKRNWDQNTYAQRKRSFEKYIYPKLENVPISVVDHRHIAEVLNPILESAPTQGVRLRQDLEGVFDRTIALGSRAGQNPADSKGPLGYLLLSENRDVEHHASLPYPEVPAFITEVQNHKAVKTAAWMAGQQLIFVILTAVRVGQTFKMRWDEVKWEERLWVCPGKRTKSRKEHVVLLNRPALAILENLRALQKQAGLELDFVFVRNLPLPGREIYYQKRRRLRQRELANVALGKNSASMHLRRGLRRGDITVHGFRTTFSSWGNDQLSPTCGFDHADIEMALDHELKNTGGDSSVRITESARIYSRNAKRLAQRRKLADAWGDYCSRPAADVIPFQQDEVKKAR